MSIRFMFFLLFLAFVLVACSPAPPAATPDSAQLSSSNPTPEPIQSSSSIPTPEPANASSSNPTTEPPQAEAPVSTAGDLARLDNQGAVEVSVTPINLDNPEETLIFEVTLNTHSVDLSMDLATLATLSTDTGKSVQAATWDAPRGGHHVEGKLSFPASVDGQPLLEGAKTLTLIIKDLDAPERVLIWELSE
jgi:hypothetical protein